MIYGIDTESFYSKEVNISSLGHYHYLRHPECDIYMVSIAGDDGFRWVGRPEAAPWARVAGHTWVHHNAAHEDAVFLAAKEQGLMPDVTGSEVFCTSDMASYLGVPASLAGACEELFKLRVDKSVRDNMKGRRFDLQTPEFQAEVSKYALADAELCLRLWVEHGHKWPEWERKLSLLTRRMGQRGVLVDTGLVDTYIGDLSRLVWEADKQIPWASHSPALSYKKLCEQCRLEGIRPPVSLAMDSDDCASWEDEYGVRYPWVAAMRQKRRANMLLVRFNTMRSRVRWDGRVSMPLKYCGASTRRWSGSSGLNSQNMSREPLMGTEARRVLIAGPGRKLVAVDLAQIEPRVLAVLSGDDVMLETLQRCDIYEAHARNTMGYDRPEALKALKDEPRYELMRRFAKARVLGLGYQCGSDKFVVVAKNLAGLTITAEESVRMVREFRESNPKIVRLWRKMQRAVEASVGSDLTITLPSGNTLAYKRIACRDGDYSGMVSKYGRMCRVKLYGGLLVENIVQATARDIFGEALLRLEEKYDLVLQTHDEAVCEVPAGVSADELCALMVIPPSWMPNIPLAAEAVEGVNYAI